MVNVTVKYKTITLPSKSSSTTKDTILAEANTESAVMKVLQKRHPNHEIVILEIK